MNDTNRPVIKVNNGQIAVAIFEQDIQTEYGPRKTYRAGLRKSYKDKTTNEWKNLDLTLFDDEMLPAAELLQLAHAELIKHKMAVKSATRETTEESSAIDEIPF